jgi:hypothetical protein
MTNIQVTHDLSASQARNECRIAINPRNPLQMVAASKRFTDPSDFRYTLATSWSDDGGQTWTPSADLILPLSSVTPPSWSGITNPGLAWGVGSNVFVIATVFYAEDQAPASPVLNFP